MSNFTTSMFDAIKDALNKESAPRGAADILRTTVGNSYEIRILPNTTDPSKTFHHYYVYGWESFATGQYTSAVSPLTIGERDPISEARYKDSRFGSVAEKERAKAIYRSEKWLVNAYVISDPTDSDNNGKVKVLRFGKQLHKIIMAAIEGEDSKEFGAKIFDLGPDGCSLRVKVESQGDYPSYVSSRFLTPGDVGLKATRIKEIYDTTHDLGCILPVKPYEDLVSILNEHYYCSAAGAGEATESTSVATTPVTPDADLTQEVPTGINSSETAYAIEDDDDNSPLDDDKIKELLAGLDDE